jgi:hypothetical protein
MYIGDLNYDFLDEKKCAPLVSVCDILDLTNLVKRPTCFTKIADPTLNDVILTNSPNNCMNVLNFNCGISDVHNLISVQIKGNINPAKKSFKTYRSFKNFSEENSVNDLMKSDLDKITEIEDVDEAYNKFEEVMVNTIAYMPTLPIYAVVYRIFKSSTPTDFRCFPTDLKKKM